MKLKVRKKIEEDKLRNKILKDYQKVQSLGSSWNPLPKREDLNKTSRLHLTVDSRAGFINCAQGYFNVGKYKGVQVKDTPIWYLTWVAEKIQLNPSELNLLRTVLKYKELKNKL
jgi:uncharacterized protein (DUF3820 family)